MRLRILCLLLLITACMPSAPETPIASVPSLSPSPHHTATDAEPTAIPFELTATQIVRRATQEAKDTQATETAIIENAQATEMAIATLNTPTRRPQDLLYFPTANGLELTLTQLVVEANLTATAVAFWTITATPLPGECAQVTDSYQELRLPVYIRASDIGIPEHRVKEITTSRCPADEWSLPYEYLILILPQEHSDDTVIVAAIDDIIRRLPNYSPIDPNAENPVTVQIQFFDNSTLFAGRFNYQDGIDIYESGLRRERLLRALNVAVEYR